MKQIILLFTITTIVAAFSCSKPNISNSVPAKLAGNWRMVTVTDNQNGIAVTKPSSILGDVDIVFDQENDTLGNFSGKTPTNDISRSHYFTKKDRTLVVPALNMTKVVETAWGSYFVDNIRNAQAYSFSENGNLEIKTTDKMLIFNRR